MLKKPVQQGRNEREGEAYALLYVEPWSDARTLGKARFVALGWAG